jgi:hypothetical protein
MRTKYLSLIIAGLLSIVATGCIVSVEPERAVNPVGTDHTVTVEVRDAEELEQLFCEVLVDIIEEYEEELPYNPCLIDAIESADIAEYVSFRILSGPNAGMNSAQDGVCEPLCTEPSKDNRYSWTYQSNGQAGRDVIEVCSNIVPVLTGEAELSDDEFEQLILDAINDALGTDYDAEDDLICQEVEKQWIDRNDRPNIGAGLSGLFQGQPTPLPTTAAPAAPSPVIRPPSTGDAGLAD